MSSKATLSWISYIERALLECDQIPMMGEAPAFSWQQFSSFLSNFLNIESLHIHPKEWAWIHAEKIKELLGEKAVCINVGILPLQGKVSLLLNETDLNSLIIWLTEKRAGVHGIIPTHFKNGFLNYLCVEMMHQMQKLPFFDGFLLRKLSDTSVSTARSLGLDLQLKAYGETLNLHVLVPEQFRKNWIQHFLQRPVSWTERDHGHLELKCALEMGTFLTSFHEWKEVQVGDFIPVPSIRVDPENFSGSLNLTISHKPLFRVRLKDQGFKILEQMHFEEESLSMDDETFDDENFSDEYSSDVEEEKEEVENEETTREEPISSKKETLSKIGDIPLNVSVELARFNMTCSKLVQLKPGNLLELNVPLQKPVNLVINGKVIAQGELIQVGEVIGVRILNRS